MVYAGMDSSSGELVAVHYWNITSPARKMILTDAERAKLDKYLKTISTVEQVAWCSQNTFNVLLVYVYFVCCWIHLTLGPSFTRSYSHW